MTRNPETTEAARAALLARLSRILGEVPVGTLDLLNVLTGPDCASYTAAVLAVSPAVTERDGAIRMREALRLIAAGGCSNRTVGRCSGDPNRSPIAEYTAERWCDECIAAHALSAPPAVTEGERAGRRVPPPNYALAGTVSDEFGVRAAPSPAVRAAEDETRNDLDPGLPWCEVCDGEGFHFANCTAPAPVVAAVPADPNEED